MEQVDVCENIVPRRVNAWAVLGRLCLPQTRYSPSGLVLATLRVLGSSPSGSSPAGLRCSRRWPLTCSAPAGPALNKREMCLRETWQVFRAIYSPSWPQHHVRRLGQLSGSLECRSRILAGFHIFLLKRECFDLATLGQDTFFIFANRSIRFSSRHLAFLRPSDRVFKDPQIVYLKTLNLLRTNTSDMAEQVQDQAEHDGL